MKWLKRILGLGGLDTEAVMDQALHLARSGHQVEAVSQMQSALDAVKESAGCPSCQYAKGLFNLAMLQISIGDMAQGAKNCRLAADSCPDTSAGRKDRLMYLMNAGQLLSRTGETEAAIEVLRTSLEEREAAYGLQHAGTAYGQRALAEVYMLAGRFDEGLALSEQALAIFLTENHHEYPSSLATTTALASAMGMPDEEIWKYPPSEVTSITKPMIDSALTFAESMPDKTGMLYLRQLSDWASERLPPDSPQMMNIVATWSNIANEQGDNEQRQLAIDRAVDAAKKLGDTAVLVNALEARALMLADIDSATELVRDAYALALSNAVDQELDSDAAGVLRNWALYESESGFPEEAQKRFMEAIEKADGSGDDEIFARTEIALGIFHQHNDRADQAVPLLEAGIEKLDPMHPDVACAVLHQVALEEDLDCPCHGTDEIAKDALSQLAKRFFTRSGLGDIIESVNYHTSDDGEKGLKVQLSREPTAQEMQRLGIAQGVFQNLLGNADAPTRG